MKILAHISKWQAIRDHVKTQRQHSSPESAYCASGRLQYWLQWEPCYRTKTYSSAVEDPRLWNYIQKLVPSAGLAQVFYGNRGIDWHRDAAYAHSEAYLLSLGTSTFEVEGMPPLKLTGGEFISFDCKRRHRAYDVHPDRIGIGIWTPKISLPG